MSHHRRLSQSITGGTSGSWRDSFMPPSLAASVSVPDDTREEWLTTWKTVLARDLIDTRIVVVDAETSVEEACDKLLSEDIPCLAIKARQSDPTIPVEGPYEGLFDFADVNAFLTLAATRHTLPPEEIRSNPRVEDIVSAAKAGRVPVYLVSNLSQKNPIEILPHNASLISLLGVVARGAHRTLIRSMDDPNLFLGMVSDRSLLSYFSAYAKQTPSFQSYLSNPIQYLALPSLNLNSEVVSAGAEATILDAMRLMSEQGVSSVAVLEEGTGVLLSAVSVTDIGKIVVPAQSNQILTAPLHQFISHIKEPDGSMDGADKYPVYSVLPTSLLSFTIDKLLATNAHRVFVTHDSGASSPGMSPSSSSTHGNVTGIVSIVDILSLFARAAKIPNVDPTSMQRHRRASSSASSTSSISDSNIFARSRSNSRVGIRRSPSLVVPAGAIAIPIGGGVGASTSPPAVSILEVARAAAVATVQQAGNGGTGGPGVGFEGISMMEKRKSGALAIPIKKSSSGE